MKYPKKLKKGDCIGLVCPSSPIETEKIEECKAAVEKLGFKTKLADNLDLDFGYFMAGDGEVRANWINQMFKDPEVDGIICVRGGDGAGRLLEHLDAEIIKNNPKFFMGYSDVTVLNLFINQICGFTTFHGPMVYSNMLENFDDETKESFLYAANADAPYQFKNPEGEPIKTLKEGVGEGEITGGNLSLINASIGTIIDIDTKDKVLFIEEVTEPITKFDKWLFQLRNSGKFNDCRGIIIGQITDCTNDFNKDYTILDCFIDATEGFDFPILYNVASGHDFPMMTIPLGAKCRIDGYKSTIEILPERVEN